MWQEKKGTENSLDILTMYEHMNIITYEQMIKRKNTKDKDKEGRISGGRAEVRIFGSTRRTGRTGTPKPAGG
jgi:hypothetical protein